MINTLETLSGWNPENIKRGNAQLATVVQGKQTLSKLEEIEKERLEGLRDLLVHQGATEDEITNALCIFHHISMMEDISETKEEIQEFFERRNLYVRNF